MVVAEQETFSLKNFEGLVKEFISQGFQTEESSFNVPSKTEQHKSPSLSFVTEQPPTRSERKEKGTLPDRNDPRRSLSFKIDDAETASSDLVYPLQYVDDEFGVALFSDGNDIMNEVEKADLDSALNIIQNEMAQLPNREEAIAGKWIAKPLSSWSGNYRFLDVDKKDTLLSLPKLSQKFLLDVAWRTFPDMINRIPFIDPGSLYEEEEEKLNAVADKIAQRLLLLPAGAGCEICGRPTADLHRLAAQSETLGGGNEAFCCQDYQKLIEFAEKHSENFTRLLRSQASLTSKPRNTPPRRRPRMDAWFMQAKGLIDQANESKKLDEKDKAIDDLAAIDDDNHNEPTALRSGNVVTYQLSSRYYMRNGWTRMPEDSPKLTRLVGTEMPFATMFPRDLLLCRAPHTASNAGWLLEASGIRPEDRFKLSELAMCESQTSQLLQTEFYDNGARFLEVYADSRCMV